jgi:formate dehydrogenase major subunit
MGSNFAECHPVGFRWVMKAKERGAKVIHIDPRFTRTSAMADLHVAIRSGTDIAFLGGLINYILSHDRWFKDYVLHYTNAATIVSEKFRDTEDLAGLFSGYNEEARRYETLSWCYFGTEPGVMHPEHEGPPEGRDTHSKEGQPGVDYRRHPPRTDPTLQHPRCVFQILKRHYARYTPDQVAEICGCTVAEFERVAQTLSENSGRERTSAFAYAVGWTQHTVGVSPFCRAWAVRVRNHDDLAQPGAGAALPDGFRVPALDGSGRLCRPYRRAARSVGSGARRNG